MLNVTLYSCFQKCDNAAMDIYFLAGLANHFLKMYNSLQGDADGLDSIEQITQSYFDVLQPAPYLVNLSLAMDFKSGRLKDACYYGIRVSGTDVIELHFFNLSGDHIPRHYVYGSDQTSAEADVAQLIKHGVNLSAKV